MSSNQNHNVGRSDFSSIIFAVVFIGGFFSFGLGYWNHSRRLDQELSATSYDIYLTHYWFVVALQAVLLKWAGGPVLAKAAGVFIVTLVLSFAISRWVLARHSRAFAILLLALFVFCFAVRP